MCHHLLSLSYHLDIQVYRIPVDVRIVGRGVLLVLSSSARIQGHHGD